MLGKHGDIGDVESLGQTGHVKTANRYFIVINDVVRGAGKLRGIVALLRLKLHANKSRFLLVVPGHKREFLGARAGINLQKKRPVGGLDRTQRNSMVFAHGSRTRRLAKSVEGAFVLDAILVDTDGNEKKIESAQLVVLQ